jgi:hypothetical protein
MTNLDLILKRFFAKYGRDYEKYVRDYENLVRDYENLSILKDSMLAAYAIAMAGGYDGTFAEWLDFIFAPGRVHGCDIYIQDTPPATFDDYVWIDTQAIDFIPS